MLESCDCFIGIGILDTGVDGPGATLVHSDIRLIAGDLTRGGDCCTEIGILDTGFGNSFLGVELEGTLRLDLLVAGDTPVLILSGDKGLLTGTYGVAKLEETLECGLLLFCNMRMMLFLDVSYLALKLLVDMICPRHFLHATRV